MPIEKFSHIAIAVQDLEAQIAHYRDVLGLRLLSREVIEDQQVKVAMFEVGESRLELLEPLTPESPVGRFLQKKGEGIHHVAFAVSDLRADLDRAKKKGLRLIDEHPRPGAHGAQIAFLHPKSTYSVLTEFCDEGDSKDAKD